MYNNDVPMSDAEIRKIIDEEVNSAMRRLRVRTMARGAAFGLVVGGMIVVASRLGLR